MLREERPQNLVRLITELVEYMDTNGIPPWRKPWDTRQMNLSYHNPLSGTTYTGANVWFLHIASQVRGFTDPRFATFVQIGDKGGKVKAGAKGIPLVRFVERWESPAQVSARLGHGVDEATYQEYRRIQYFAPTCFVVFNLLEHTEGLDLPPLVTEVAAPPELETAEALIAATGAKMGMADKAFYSVQEDRVYVPPRAAFGALPEYYATTFHELGHWSGAAGRLARDGVVKFDGFGTERYAYEELIAELTACQLCGSVGITEMPQIENSAAYIASWKQRLQQRPLLLVNAVRESEAAVKFIQGFQQGQATETA